MRLDILRDCWVEMRLYQDFSFCREKGEKGAKQYWKQGDHQAMTVIPGLGGSG